MDVRFLGGVARSLRDLAGSRDARRLVNAREIGRSAILVNDRLLLDYGMAGGGESATPLDVEPDAVVVSHGHLDHVGMVPALLKGDRRPPIHWTFTRA